MVVPKGIPFGHLFNSLPHDDLGFFKTVEDLPIQKVISKGAVKAFTKAILPRTAGFNVSGFHSNAG
jgi:hypothetical protein